jgi:hypothetical protein
LACFGPADTGTGVLRRILGSIRAAASPMTTGAIRAIGSTLVSAVGAVGFGILEGICIGVHSLYPPFYGKSI